MSKYSDKTFEKILDDMCKRVKECVAMKVIFNKSAYQVSGRCGREQAGIKTKY